MELKEEYDNERLHCLKNNSLYNPPEYLLCKIRYWFTHNYYHDSGIETYNHKEFYENYSHESGFWEALYDSISDTPLKDKILNKVRSKFGNFELWKNKTDSYYNVYRISCLNIFKHFINYENNIQLDSSSPINNIETYQQIVNKHFDLIDDVIESINKLIDFEDSNNIWKQFDLINDIEDE